MYCKSKRLKWLAIVSKTKFGVIIIVCDNRDYRFWQLDFPITAFGFQHI